MNSFNNTLSYDEGRLLPTPANKDSKEFYLVPKGLKEKENIPLEEPSLIHSNPKENKKYSSHNQGKECRTMSPEEFKLPNDIRPSLTNLGDTPRPNICKHSISDTPSLSQFEYKLGESQTQSGHYDSKNKKNLFSQENLERDPIIISENDGNLNRWHFERGNKKFREEKFTDAKKHYKEALRLNPKSFEALYNLAISFYITGKSFKARYYLTKANKIRPTSKGYKLLGQLSSDKELKCQKYFFTQALKLDPTDCEVHLLLGNMYTKYGSYNNAKRQYFKVIEMCKNQENDQNQSWSLQLPNEWDGIEGAFSEDCSAINCESQDISFEIIFSIALEKTRTDFKAYFNGAQLLTRIGFFDRAMKIYQEIEVKFPECRIATYYKMAQLYILEKKFLDAAKMFAKVFVPPKINVDELNEEQKTILKNIDERFPDANKRHARKGHYFVKIGKLEEALAEFEASYDLCPNDYLSNWHLAKIYSFLGRIEDAAAKLERAHSINKKINEYVRVIGVTFDSSIKTLQS